MFAPNRILALVALVCLPPVLGAQSSDEVRVNDRLRFRRLGDSHRLVGTVIDRRGDTLVIRDSDGMTHRLHPLAMRDVQRSIGRSSSASAKKGAVVGAIGGGVLAAIREPNQAVFPGGQSTAGIVLSWTALGAVAGALKPDERWRSITIATSAPVASAAAAVPASPTDPVTTAATPTRPVVTAGVVYDSIPASETLLHTSRVLSPGDVIRYSLFSAPRLQGTVVAASQDSLRVLRGGIEQRLSFDAIDRLERYYGRTARAGGMRMGARGAAVGGVLGALTGMALAGLGAASRQPNYAGAALGMGALGAGVGFAYAYPMGAAHPADDWRTVRREDLRK